MSKCVKILFVLLFINSLTTAVASCEEQYNHIWTVESEIPESNLWYGYHISISDDLILTSEHYATVNGIQNAGKVHLFDSSGTLITSLQSPNPGTSYEFGIGFDIYGDMIAVHDGTWINDIKAVGEVHVFKTDGTLQYTLQPQEFHPYALFGVNIAIGEEILLITEKGVEMSPPVQGKVHIYNHDGEFIKTIYSPNPTAQGLFGGALEVGSGLILISQYGDVWNIGPGFVYVYDLDGNYLMTLESPEPEDRACFGLSMSILGDKIVVSEYKATVDGKKFAGKVHIYDTDGEYLRTLVSPIIDANSKFGVDVAISGDLILVGEELGNIDPFGEEGRAYVFNVDGTLIQNLTSPDPSPRGAFGLSVDIQDDVLIVSECWAQVDKHEDSGRIHVYKLGAPVETHESVEETTTTISEDEPDANRSIPGYPVLSIVLALLLIPLFLTNKVTK